MSDLQDNKKLQELFQEAIALHQSGELTEAVTRYIRVLEHFPDADLVQYNLGLALFCQEDYTQAVEAFEQAVAVNNGDADYWYNLALSYRKCGLLQDAEEGYQKALVLGGDAPDIWYNLGSLYKDTSRIEMAIACYEKVLMLNPDYSPALTNLAYLLHLGGEYDRAEKYYARLLQLQPENPAALHMLAAIRGEGGEGPPQEYVRELFDQFSDHFDETLIQGLEYRVPGLLWELFAQDYSQHVFSRVLDLGCGTGLCGRTFRPVSTYLHGVDLSGKMVEQAREKKIYDQLNVEDLGQFLATTSDSFDLVLAADVFTYLGELESLFHQVAARSTNHGVFCFSVEQYHGEGFTLRSTGRYAHSRGYISKLVESTGWQVSRWQEANLRREGDYWIAGLLYLLIK